MSKDINQKCPLFECKVSNPCGYPKIISEKCSFLIDNDCLNMDMFIPAHQALKMGCNELELTRKCVTVGGTISIRQMSSLLVEFCINSDDFKPPVIKAALLEVWVDDNDYQALKNDAKYNVIVIEDTAEKVSPIKYIGNELRGKVIIGLPGTRKLEIKYDNLDNSLSLFDDYDWAFL